MSTPLVVLASLLIVVLLIMIVGVFNAVAMRRDLNRTFEQLRRGLEADAAYLVNMLLRRRPRQHTPRKPRNSYLRRVK